MSNINLLPEEFRRREAKELERLAKKPKVFQINLSQPMPERKINLNSDKPKKSFWEKVFGTRPPKPVAPAVRPKTFAAGSGSPAGSSIPARKEKIIYRPVEMAKLAPKPQVSFWDRTFGPPRPPIKPALENGSRQLPRPIKPEPAGWPAKNIIKEVSVKPAKRSFWAELFGRRQAKVKPARVKSAFFMAPKPKVGPIHPSLDLAPKPKDVVQERLLKSNTRLNEAAAKKESQAREREAKKYHLAPKSSKLKFDINLLPEELALVKRGRAWPKVAAIVLALALPALAVYGVYRIIDYEGGRVQQELSEGQKTINELKKELVAYQSENKKGIASKQRLLAIKDLLDEHIYWSKFFATLERYTLDGVYFTGLTADTSGSFVLPAIAQSYDVLARQVVAFEGAKDFVKEVRPENAKLYSVERRGAVGVSFDLKITLVSDFFKK